MIEMSVSSNARQLAKDILDHGPKVQDAVNRVTVEYGSVALALIRKNASGRPGPRRRTGDYVRSWGLRIEDGASGAGGLFGRGSVALKAVVGTAAPQARRLERGFFGRDSLGRMYRQRGFPHLKPTGLELKIRYPHAVRQAVRQVAIGR